MPGAGKITSEILAKEGMGALFKGALPRALWVAPLGAMNFAGYELAKGALKDKREEHENPADPAPLNPTGVPSARSKSGAESLKTAKT